MISQCRYTDCNDFAENDAHPCDTHMAEHDKRCVAISQMNAGGILGGKNTNGAEDSLKRDIGELMDKHAEGMRKSMDRVDDVLCQK